jgi:hypothetical protein
MKNLIFGSLVLVASFALAHGGDKPGLHGGFVEMPGTFHTEVVPEKGNSFKVYLIDINFQNPSIKDSSVEAWIEGGSKKSSLNCVSKEDYFQCNPTDKTVKGKKLIIKAKREQMQGNEVTYKLPIRRE